jgi:hypothetical protein
MAHRRTLPALAAVRLEICRDVDPKSSEVRVCGVAADRHGAVNQVVLFVHRRRQPDRGLERPVYLTVTVAITFGALIFSSLRTTVPDSASIQNLPLAAASSGELINRGFACSLNVRTDHRADVGAFLASDFELRARLIRLAQETERLQRKVEGALERAPRGLKHAKPDMQESTTRSRDSPLRRRPG